MLAKVMWPTMHARVVGMCSVAAILCLDNRQKSDRACFMCERVFPSTFMYGTTMIIRMVAHKLSFDSSL
jgi:hypothetical protein